MDQLTKQLTVDPYFVVLRRLDLGQGDKTGTLSYPYPYLSLSTEHPIPSYLLREYRVEPSFFFFFIHYFRKLVDRQTAWHQWTPTCNPVPRRTRYVALEDPMTCWQGVNVCQIRQYSWYAKLVSQSSWLTSGWQPSCSVTNQSWHGESVFRTEQALRMSLHGAQLA